MKLAEPLGKSVDEDPINSYRRSFGRSDHLSNREDSFTKTLTCALIKNKLHKQDNEFVGQMNRRPREEAKQTNGENPHYFYRSVSTLKLKRMRKANNPSELIDSFRSAKEIEAQFLKSTTYKKREKMLNLRNKTNCLFCINSTSLHSVSSQILLKKYRVSMETYYAKVSTDLIFNENAHVVSQFKDFLVYDDVSEFLKRTYSAFEIWPRLQKINEFYSKYTQVFPNYIVIPEKKFMFKNIERKQKMIDKRQEEPHKKLSENASLLFTETFRKETFSEESKIQYVPVLKNLDKKTLGEMRLKDILEMFVAKDSLSSINVSLATVQFGVRNAKQATQRWD